jgi:hypothetical protein
MGGKMRKSSGLCIGFLLGILSPGISGRALASDNLFTDHCLASPNRDINFSQSLDNAISNLREKNVKLTYKDAGVDFADKNQDNSENRKTLTIVQKAISDHTVALMEACLFYATSCAASAGNPAVAQSAINLVQTICSSAMKSGDAGGAKGRVAVSPSTFRAIDLQPNTPGRDMLVIENTGNNPASFLPETDPSAKAHFVGSCAVSDNACAHPTKGLLNFKGHEQRIAVFELDGVSPAMGFVSTTIVFKPTKTPQGFITEEEDQFSTQYMTSAVAPNQSTACEKWNDQSDCLKCVIKEATKRTSFFSHA